ncbi:MAG: Asp23/Gls24 family envelope stress response protein [Gaiellaceae bacterium]
MEGRASISTDVLARYAADAAREVEGVRGLVESRLPRHHGVRVTSEDGVGRARVELHLVLAWGASAPEVGRAVQRRVGEYLERMTGARPDAVDVVVDEIGPPS